LLGITSAIIKKSLVSLSRENEIQRLATTTKSEQKTNFQGLLETSRHPIKDKLRRKIDSMHFSCNSK